MWSVKPGILVTGAHLFPGSTDPPLRYVQLLMQTDDINQTLIQLPQLLPKLSLSCTDGGLHLGTKLTCCGKQGCSHSAVE